MKKIFDEVETSFEKFRNEFTHQKRESLVGMIRQFYNQLDIITTTCFIKKSKIAMT